MVPHSLVNRPPERIHFLTQPLPRTMPALITALDERGEIDGDAQEHNTSVAVANGAAGVLLAGSTGQGPYLEPGERKHLTAITKSSFPNLAIVCGIFAESDRQAMSQIREAEQGGADAVLVVTPVTLIRDRHDLVVDFFGRIADASPLPVLLYSVPGVTGYALPISSVTALANHPNIVGMKDSGGDATRMRKIVELLNNGFVVYCGASRSLVDFSANGAYGAITASANYAFSLVDAAGAGGVEAQRALTDLTTIIEQERLPGTLCAASLAGMVPGRARLPLRSLSPVAARRIADAMEQAGLIENAMETPDKRVGRR